MADIHSKEIRSFNMSRIRSKDTKPELLVRKFLFSRGFRYRLHSKQLPGHPDIVLPRYRTIINVNGCFWHGHSACPSFVIPKTRTQWWIEKINKNIQRDINNNEKSFSLGWKVITIFECELKPKNFQTTMENLLRKLLN